VSKARSGDTDSNRLATDRHKQASDWPTDRRMQNKMYTMTVAGGALVFTVRHHIHYYITVCAYWASTSTSRRHAAPRFNRIRPCSVKMWGPSHKFSDINVQKLAMNSTLVAVLLLLPYLRYGSLISEALSAAPSELFKIIRRHEEASQAKNCCTSVQHSLACVAAFCGGPCSAEHVEHA